MMGLFKTRRDFLKGLAMLTGASALPAGLMGGISKSHASVSAQSWDLESLEWLRKLEQEVAANSKGYEYLYHSAHQIGHRLAGTENARKAEKYIEHIFNDMGVEVELQPFDCKLWVYDSHFTYVNIDGGRELDSALLTWGPNVSKATGEIIYIGDGTKADWEAHYPVKSGKGASGKVILLPQKSSSGESLTQRVIHAENYGCSAVLLMGNRPHNSPMQIGVVKGRKSKRTLIPCYCLGDKDSVELRERALNGEKVLLTFSAQSHPHDTSSLPIEQKEKNIIATIPGTEKPEEVVIIGGHWDSWALGDGSVDNGVGIYQIIDIARTFTAMGFKPKRTVKFVLWGAEEQGHHGSRYHVNKMWEEGEIDNVKFVINIDMKCAQKGFNCLGREDSFALCNDLGKQIQQVDSSYANDNKFKKFGLSSDHRAFVLKGIPTVLPIESTEKRFMFLTYHSKQDLIGEVKEEYLTESARLMGSFLMEVANADTLPRRLTSDETKAMLTASGFGEKKLGSDWELIVD